LEAPRVFSPVDIEMDQLQTYAGRFTLDNENETELQFSVSEEQLVVDIPNNPTFPLTYGGEDYFYLEGYPLSFKFLRGEANEIKGVELTQGDVVFSGSKVD
ncbi:MAG: hypothetical protein AAF544_10055, partial [Bacteroidota bacterium]